MTMFLQFFYLIIISILLVVFKTPANMLLNLIQNTHQYLVSKLALIFSNSYLGLLLQQIFGLLIICTIVALVFMLIYWLIYRAIMPNFFPVLWFLWIILLVTLTLNR